MCQRQAHEKSKRAALIRKLKRTDVQEDDSLLNDVEKRAKEECEVLEDKLEVSMMRLDEVILLLRDF